ncbi:unnamed protein product, partial [Ectocarpus sp. 8 AP-2014]
VVRAYRDFVESFGNNFMAPPARGGAKENRVTPRDAAQHKRTQHLSELLRLLLRVTHHLGREGNADLPQRRPRRASISWQARGGDDTGSRRLSAARPPSRADGDDDDQDANEEAAGDSECGVYLPETLDAAVFLLSRLQSVMTRAWDPTPTAAAADNDAGMIAAALGGRPSAISSVASEYGGSAVPGSSVDEGDDRDALVDTFIGSTRRPRKWDWVRCCHSPINPVLAAGGGRGGPGHAGSNAQPVVAPVAIDPGFCHRTLRPGRPGPEGCTLEQVCGGFGW